jgi:hypothetical protein
MAEDAKPTESAEAWEPLLRVTWLSDLKVPDRAGWIVREVLPQGGIGVLWGPPYHGKTTTAIALAMAVESGAPYWLGWKLDRHGPVLFMTQDGSPSTRLQALAWCAHHDVERKGRVAFVDAPPGTTLAAMEEELIEKRDEIGAVLIIVDSLAEVWGDESNGGFRDLAAVCRRLASEDCAVLMIHHCGHDGEHERGGSTLRAAFDSSVHIHLPEGSSIGNADVLKVRGARPSATGFCLVSIELGVGADDAPICAAVALSAKAPPKPGRLNGNHRIVLGELVRMVEIQGVKANGGTATGTATVSRPVLKEKCVPKLGGQKPARAYENAMTWLVAHGYVDRNDDLVWLTEDGPPLPLKMYRGGRDELPVEVIEAPASGADEDERTGQDS